MHLSPLRANGTLVEEVCARLSDVIRKESPDTDGWLPPERELAERLGVSRPVVREATKRLEMQGLVEIQHGVGTRVVDKLHKPLSGSLALRLPNTAERLRQLTEARQLIEPSLARLAAARATAGQLIALRKTQTQLAAAQTDDEAIEADLQFHHRLALASGNDICALLLDSLAELGRESRKTTLAAAGKAVALTHHALILDAVEKRQPDAAFEAMTMHLAEAEKDIARGLKLRRSRS